MKVDFNSELTVQQQKFVAEYCTDFNQVRAAIAAGYSKKSAPSQASQLLNIPKIQSAIQANLENYGNSFAVLKQRVVNQLVNLAFSDMRDFVEFDGSGVRIKPSESLTSAQAAAISEVTETTTSNQFGGNTHIKFKLAQKDRALELLGRHLGMFSVGVPEPEKTDTAQEAKPKLTFEEFCLNGGYFKPFPKQVEMYEFGILLKGARILLGARGLGKTDYVTVAGAAYAIYLDPTTTFLIVTKSTERNAAILREIANLLMANGVELEKDSSKGIRVKGLIGKDHSASAITIRSCSTRGRHPKCIIMDDPVTPDDISEAERKRVQRTYNELHKLCDNILIIGQPVHKYDLYETLRPILKQKMEVPHGMIPELDADLDAQRAAGVDEPSIQASYFLKVMNIGSTPFDKIKYIDKFPKGDSAVAWIDPSQRGGDNTALTIARAYMDGVAVVGFQWQMAYNHCLDEIYAKLLQYGVKRIAIETNALGDLSVDVLRQAFKGIGVVGRDTLDNKHSKIMAAGTFAHRIHLSKESHPSYIEHTVKYEYKSEPDDAPDSLASLLVWLGLVRGKQGKGA